MKISKQAKRDAKALFQSCRVNGRLDEGRVRQAVAQVIARKPRGFAAILSHFHRLVRLEVARRTARIESAVAPSDVLMAGLRAGLERRYGPGLNVTFAVNPELIGGLRVRVGSDVYDGSIQARLTALAESF